MESGGALNAFSVGDRVIYPSHGVGHITEVEEQAVAGTKMEWYVISFYGEKGEKRNMVLRVPKRSAHKTLRPLGSAADLKKAVNVLKGRGRNARGVMWNKRAQVYEAKINSGDIVKIAEVVRDLHRSSGDRDPSYSEKLTYETALNRLSQQFSAINGGGIEQERAKLVAVLEYRDYNSNADAEADEGMEEAGSIMSMVEA